MSCGFCVCVLISRKHGNRVMRKDKLVELRAFMIPWGSRGLFTDYFKYTSAYTGF